MSDQRYVFEYCIISTSPGRPWLATLNELANNGWRVLFAMEYGSLLLEREVGRLTFDGVLLSSPDIPA